MKRCRCPRCRYDLSGETGRWAAAGRCPLRGRCPECGLVFTWADIFAPNPSPGYFESEERRRFRWLAKTFWRSLRPWSFWRWVRMEAEMRPARWLWMHTAALTLFVMLGLFPMFAFAAASPHVLRAQPVHSSVSQTGAWPRPHPTVFETLEFGWTAFPFGLDLLAWHLDPKPTRYPLQGGRPVSLALLLLPIVGMPLLGLLLGGTLRRAKASRAHLLRVATASVFPLSACAVATCLVVLYSQVSFFVDGYNMIVHGGFPSSSRMAHRAETVAAMFHACGVLLLVYVFLWYGFANARYLKIRRPWVVAITHMVIVLIAVHVAREALELM